MLHPAALAAGRCAHRIGAGREALTIPASPGSSGLKRFSLRCGRIAGVSSTVESRNENDFQAKFSLTIYSFGGNYRTMRYRIAG
ncbi:MAG: hypothetical protein ACREQI_12695 [Candidatus Binataceae bacterium]